MPYLSKESIAGNVLIVENYHSYRYQSKKRPRGTNVNKTSELQKSINARNAAEKNVLYALENFNVGDYWIRLSYFSGQRPSDLSAAHSNLTKLFKKLKRKCPDLYYIGVTEEGSHGGLHHHILIPAWYDINNITNEWSGGVHIKKTYSGELSQLASYLTKGELDDTLPENERDTVHHKGVKAKKVTHSRNLKKPVVRVKKSKADSWRDEPRTRIIDGVTYDIKPNTYYFGFNSDGYPYCRYIMIKRETPVICAGKNNSPPRRNIKFKARC